jgi:molybdenum cofactor biosynthesis enzyme MoaA
MVLNVAGGGIMISVDAGTRETFKRIKGIDAFDKVWENIKKYYDFGSRMLLKYIFVDENSNDTDVERFIKNVVNIGVSNIAIDRDAFRSRLYSQEQKYLMVKMYKLAKLNGINAFYGGTFNEYERYEFMQIMAQN